MTDRGKLIPLSTAQRQQARAAQQPLAFHNVTEDGAALVFEQRHAGRILFDHTVGSWFTWSGARWQRETTGLAFEWARTVARDIAVGAKKDSTKATAAKSSFALGVERFSRSARPFATTADGWDRDNFLLGTPGGTVDLHSGKLRQADAKDRITKTTAVAPAPVASCPLWLKFMHEATAGDDDLMRFLQQVCGYALTGDTREHALFFVHGDGGNGKGVFVNSVTKILGDYATTAAMDTFVSGYGSRHPTELASLHGARMVTASETEEGRAWAEARIKSLTGGDRIAARFMRQDFFEFDPRFKLLIVGNHRPTLANVDEALRRRMNFVPFVNKPRVKDRELEVKLQGEWPGILRWMIDGCLDWQANGLVRPDAVAEATERYFGDQDLLGQWLDEACDAEPGNNHKWERSADLFASWRTYAENAGEREGSAKSLSEALQKRGFIKSRGTGGGRIFRGLRLRQAPEHHSSRGSDR